MSVTDPPGLLATSYRYLVFQSVDNSKFQCDRLSVCEYEYVEYRILVFDTFSQFKKNQNTKKIRTHARTVP